MKALGVVEEEEEGVEILLHLLVGLASLHAAHDTEVLSSGGPVQALDIAVGPRPIGPGPVLDLL